MILIQIQARNTFQERQCVQLNNETLVLLSKFATKAKKHIGMVELNKMFSSQHYANNIFIKARLSDDKELAILTKIVNQELNHNPIEIKSIEAYLDTLYADGVGNEYIESCKYYLIILADYLYGIQADGKSYRQAVDSMILHADIAEQPLCLHIARAFYPFWINEHKLAYKTPNQALLKANTSDIEAQKKATSALWNTIDTEFFSSEENEKIDLYTASMLDKGISSEQISTKQKLAKIIIKQYRNEERDLHSYRKVVDKTQHLFSRQDLQEFFLVVSREFHSYWLMLQQAE